VSFAGIVGTFFGHPLDLIKAGISRTVNKLPQVRLQTQTHYTGAFDCFVKVVKNEGVRVRRVLN
jgi:hypothetical protein